MGERHIHDHPGRRQVRAFTKAVLEDMLALERMIGEGLIETGVRRVGAEQEMFLVDQHMRPAMVASEVLDALKHPQFTTELGRFNIEVNLNPQAFGGDCLWRMEQELEGLLAQARRAADACDTHVLLAGILPTVAQKDLSMDAMTPELRYRELNRSVMEQRGRKFRLVIKGLDELRVSHDNVMLEACNTSFQIHFQVGPDEFAKIYNLAQAITGPVLAAAVYSPFFLQHRLWHETRLALFQQVVDPRSEAQQARRARPRVVFGDSWVKDSILEIYREDIARFRVLLSSDLEESPLEMLDRGEIPMLKALCLHNGTVYRWNRPCYGLHQGGAHLRIEHRVLPSGPTVIDEISNAAFFFGLMVGVGEEHGDVTEVLNFDDVKNNTVAAARYGLNARFQWVGGRSYTAEELILDHLLPLARSGLHQRGVRSTDIGRYLGVIEERVRCRQTGTQWALDSFTAMGETGTLDERFRAITASMYAQHLDGRPVHRWELARVEQGIDWRESYRTVEQVMTTDLFTVGPEDLVDLAANLMDWEHIRHVPVEDKDGKLVGLITHRQLLRLVGKSTRAEGEPVAAREIMVRSPITVSPETESVRAMALMREHRVSCLPVIEKDGRLVGIVSERDFIEVASKLLEEKLNET